MKIWVRTQEKNMLLECDSIYLYGFENEKYAIKNSGDNKYSTCLGIYSTEKRALEVLDEIQMTITRIEIAKIGGFNCHEVRYVYMMPKE